MGRVRSAPDRCENCQVTGDHYFTAQPTSDAPTREVEFSVADRDYRLTSAGGVFSASRLDPGTAVLLRKAELPAADTTGDLLDLGCGFGPISCVLADLAPASTIWAVDVNARARELTAANAARIGAADRVRRSHAQTRTTLRLALVSIGAAAISALWSNTRWLPLHLLLAGGAMLAISGVSLMLTVTWSAAPAPPERWVAGQRLCVAAGAAGIALGRQTDLPAVVGVAGTAYLAGMMILAGLLLVTVRRGVQRRFDVAVAAMRYRSSGSATA